MSQALRGTVAVVAAVALAATGAATAGTASAAPGNERGKAAAQQARTTTPAFTLTIAHNNDGESVLVPTQAADGNAYGGVARFASVIDRIERESVTGRPPAGQSRKRGFLLLNSGDNYLAGATFNAGQQEGAPFYDAVAIEYLDYDVLAIGNHEFDFGPDTLAEFIEAVEGTPFVSANLDVSGEPALAALADDGRIVASTIVREKGERIGVIGLTTPALASISSPGAVEVDPDVVAVTQAQVDALTAEGVDIIILQSHLQGLDAELALVEEVTGVDAVIGGGGAELLASPGDLLVPGDTAAGEYPLYATDAAGVEVPVVTTVGNYEYAGQLVLNFDRDGEVISVDEAASGINRVSPVGPDAVEPDAFLLADVEAPVQAYLDALDANVLATSEVNLDFETPDVRGRESNGGNLMADMMFAAAEKRAAEFGVPAPDLAFHNGGGIRGNVDQPVGPFTEADTFRIAAFTNFVSIAPAMTPQVLKGILEEGAASLPSTGDGAFVQISGASYVIDPSRQARVHSGAPNFVETVPGDRIRSVVLDDGTVVVQNGVVVLDRTLSVASNDFSLGGGDAYPPSAFVRLGVQYQQALAQYLTGDLGGVVTAADYPVAGEGRITILP
ncbi:bifunctional metallophosphatase/5'-nucleotidase [Aquipuribacter sp. MA13-6]|uniref:bifunctional metallophosphatase/5'-nucleotidase n=1 Tax=unclassified Aquipuribacter TaxID=2635084 RepID=UPI003EEDAF3E